MSSCSHCATFWRVTAAFAVRPTAGQAVERFERNLPPSYFALDLDDRIERDESNTEIGRVLAVSNIARAEMSI
jgi:hypothetical protein